MSQRSTATRPRRSRRAPHSAWQVTATLLLTAAFVLPLQASAQTLIDTAAASSISTQLDQTQTSSGGTLGPAEILRRARVAAQQYQAAQTGSQAQGQTSTQTTGQSSFQVTQSGGAVTTTTAVPTTRPPAPGADLQAQLDQAAALIDSGSPAQAQARYQQLVAQNYTQPAAHFGLAQALLAGGDLAGAQFEFQQTLSLDPGSAAAAYNLGVIARVKAGQDASAEATADFTQALALATAQTSGTNLKPYLTALASEQARQPGTPGLETTLSALLALTPDDATLTLQLAASLVAASKPAQALGVLYPLRQQDPGNVQAALATAQIYQSQGLPRRALSELTPAITASSDAGRATLLTAQSRLLAQLGDPGALQAARDAVQADRQNLAALSQLAAVYTQKGQQAQALDTWKAAAVLAPRDALVQSSYASALLARGLNQQALSAATAALKLSTVGDQRPGLLFVQGVAQFRRGNFSASRSALSSSVALRSSAEGLLWLGSADFALKDYASASVAFAASNGLSPAASTRRRQASALINAGRPAEAEPLLKALVTASSGDAEAWYLLGLSRRAQGREAEAKTSLTTAAQLGWSQAKAALRVKAGTR